jgi:hypothetical protein
MTLTHATGLQAGLTTILIEIGKQQRNGRRR